MATVNLGAIRFNWKGAYNNSTAYVVDDVVSSAGNSYICILASTGNAVSNATYWSIMSSAGTNGTDGTDVGTTITTQGDILFRDGSGLQRLAKGTAAQALIMNAGATAPEWGEAGGGAWNVVTSWNHTSNVGLVEFTTGIDSTYDQYCFILSNLIASAGSVNLQMQVRDTSTGGGSFNTSNYQYKLQDHDSSGTGFSARNNTSEAHMLLADNAYKVSMRIWLPDPSDTAYYKFISWEGSHSDGSGNCQINTGGGNYHSNTNAITGVKFFLNTGNFVAGRITMYGLAHA